MPTTSLALIRSNWHTFALLAILIFVLGSPLIMAQIQSTNLYSSGSIYSAYGIGYPVELETGSAKSHGILGLTSVNQEVAGLSNPAFWAQTYYTQGASGVGLQNSQLKNTSNTGESTLFDKGYLQLLFPLKSSELGLSVGLYPVTRSNLKIINEEQFLTYGDTVGYNSELQQIGGLNKLPIKFLLVMPALGGFFQHANIRGIFFQFLTIFATKANINH